MSIFAVTPHGSDWSPYRFQSHSTTDLSLARPGNSQLDSNYVQSHVPNVESRPALRSHKSFPHTIGPSSFSATHYQSPLSQAINPEGPKEQSALVGDHDRGKPKPPGTTVETILGGSAPTSPISHLSHFSPISPKAEQDDSLDEDDDEILMTTGNLEEDGGESGLPKTAAERRAEKRKMKRFR